MNKISNINLTSALIKAFAFAIGIGILFLFARSVMTVVLLFLLSIVFAMILNAPVTWLERKKIPRAWGTFLLIFLILLIVGLVSWLIVPMVGAQLKSLMNDLPVYIDKIQAMLSSWKSDYFPWIDKGNAQKDIAQNLPPLTNTLWTLGGYSISFLSSFLSLLVILSLTAYIVIAPGPLLRFYLSLFPIRLRDNAANAFAKTSGMLVGWMRSNLIGGSIKAVSVTVVLNIMNVPGAWVWGVLAFFADMIPRIGFFIMVIPPTLVALSISPMKALWVFLFFLAMDEIVDDLIMPRLRSRSMNLHPVAIMFFLLIMGAAFGFIGALLATPVAAFAKSFYEEFYLTRLTNDERMEKRIESIIQEPRAGLKSRKKIKDKVDKQNSDLLIHDPEAEKKQDEIIGKLSTTIITEV
ncbi:MAG: AI-2E family transporter [Chitinophagales bacterium]